MIFDFTKEADILQWYILDDGVMGGLSQGNFIINKDGNCEYTGRISLDNNGGFSSLRYRCGPTEIGENSHLVLKIKGDGNSYQIRLKNSISDSHSYVYSFETSKEWETIKIPINEMYASFRGRKLNMPQFDYSKFEELTILYGNKKEENFKLEIDFISLGTEK